jgi:hypothetical protein
MLCSELLSIGRADNAIAAATAIQPERLHHPLGFRMLSFIRV